MPAVCTPYSSLPEKGFIPLAGGYDSRQPASLANRAADEEPSGLLSLQVYGLVSMFGGKHALSLCFNATSLSLSLSLSFQRETQSTVVTKVSVEDGDVNSMAIYGSC